jgi:hypothetical protein
LALDEPTNSDETISVNGFTFVVDKELLEQAKPLKIDMSYMGFQVLSNMELGGGGCGTGGCSPGSCGV